MNNAESLVGNTPLIELPYRDNRLNLKLEGMNPGLSVKDRVAFYVCSVLDKTVGLRGQRIVEYSSGNLAIGLAMASKIYGFHLTLIITSKTSPDKIKLLRRYGVDLIMVDENVHSEDPLGFRGFAEIIASTREAIFIDQFNNPLNPEAHRMNTASEIHRDLPETDYVFSAMGTGGTATGIAQYFRERNLPTKVIGVTPDSGKYYTHFHRLPENTRPPVTTVIEGVGEDFIPTNLHMDILKSVVEVRDELALLEIENFLDATGIHLGGSSGLAIAGAKKYIDEADMHDKDIVVICPDSGNRYLSNFVPKKDPSRPESIYHEIVEHHRKGEFPKIL